jgi:hypothetical protein
VPEESAEDEAVHIAAYDPDWPSKFEAERAGSPYLGDVMQAPFVREVLENFRSRS